MKDEIKEIYLSNLEWVKTHDNMGGVMGNIVFKDNMSYEEYQKLFKTIYFVLCDKDYITNLQTIEQQYSAILSENAELENKINNLQEENKNLLKKSYSDDVRITKAIEYINKFWKRKSYYEDYVNMNEWEKEDLLNILQGEDKDE